MLNFLHHEAQPANFQRSSAERDTAEMSSAFHEICAIEIHALIAKYFGASLYLDARFSTELSERLEVLRAGH